MSLTTDIFFYNAIMADDAIVTTVEERVFNPARPTADEERDLIPYIIISFGGLQNQSETKDDVEGWTDDVPVHILCVADSRDSLGDLAEAVRLQVREYWKEHDGESGVPLDWHFSASEVSYDPDKPCCYQTLHYDCNSDR